jgi:Cu2+-exporting ATPase
MTLELEASQSGASCPVVERVDCSHCGLPVAPADVVPESPQQFCCNGCAAVFAAIHDQGLERYYQLRSQAGKSAPTRASGRNYKELDDPAFSNLHVRVLPSGLSQVELYLEGVHCSACVWIVERLTLILPGVMGSRLDLHRSSAEIVWDSSQVALSEIARKIDQFGYPVHPFRGAATRLLRRQEERTLLMRIGLAWAVSGNVMMMSLSLYAGWFSDMDADTTQLFRWVSMLVTVPSITWAARPFYQGAWSALRNRLLHMDLPVAIGLTAGYLGGAWNVFRGEGEIYFDSVASLIFLLLVGRWVQVRQRRQASDAAELLFSLAPGSAHLVDPHGGVADVAIERVQAGDLVEVRSGETFPADGIIELGRTSVDASVLTGESRPVDVGVGDRVHAGTTNVASQVRVRTEHTGEGTRVGKLMQAVEEASRRRAPIVALADAIVGRFVAVILSLALITALLWLYLDPAMALDNAVALLIVTCPCALGLATPLAVHAAVGRAARLGILIKGGDVVERLSKPATVLFDKTGTLTQGKIQLQATAGDASVFPLVLALEKQSSHPLARAVVQAWPELAAAQALDVEQTVGGGLRGIADGQAVVVGSAEFVQALAKQSDFDATAQVMQWALQGLTPVLVAVDGRIRAALAFGDPLRADAKASLDALRNIGCRVGILSGDHPQVVAAVAAQLGLDPALCWGGATPEAKLAAVEREKAHGDVVMVGDGVNDAAALAAATVGVSVHGGAEASLQAADAFLTRPGLEPVVELIDGARRTVAVIRRNIAFSLVYNLVGVALAMSGVLSPLVAAVLMPISSLTVVSSSFKSRTFARRTPEA